MHGGCGGDMKRDPWLLLRMQDVDGDKFMLCDLATAGMAGTPNVNWLPPFVVVFGVGGHTSWAENSTRPKRSGVW